MLANSPEAEAVQWPPHGKEMLKKKIHKKGRFVGEFRASLIVFYQSYSHPGWWYNIP